VEVLLPRSGVRQHLGQPDCSPHGSPGVMYFGVPEACAISARHASEQPVQSVRVCVDQSILQLTVFFMCPAVLNHDEASLRHRGVPACIVQSYFLLVQFSEVIWFNSDTRNAPPF
jgi:hypothetical protein